jgi:hypothetical protein
MIKSGAKEATKKVTDRDLFTQKIKTKTENFQVETRKL